MSDPTVSIVLPTFNGARFLGESIESCLAQSYRYWELIIVDDASQDATPEIVERYLQSDPRIRSIRHETNRRLPAALNTGFAQARGAYLTWTSDDNRYLPEALREMVTQLERLPDCALTFADYALIDEAGRSLRAVQAGDPGHLHLVNCIGPCFLYRREVWERLGGYAEDLFLVEDYDYWLRVWLSFPVAPLHKELYQFRSHAGSLTQQRQKSIGLALERLLATRLPALSVKGRQVRFQTLVRLTGVAWSNRHVAATLRYLLAAALADPAAFLRRMWLRAEEFLRGATTDTVASPPEEQQKARSLSVHQRGTYFNNSRSEVAQFLPDRYAKVLEVGCGEGCFRANLAPECEYWGIEPDENAARLASSRLDKVLPGDFESSHSNLPDDYFDLVICNDVIEHLADPRDFFQKVSAKMKSGSYIVGSVPNVRQIDNLIELLVFKDWKYRENGVLDRTHLRFFTFKSLGNTLLASDLVIDKISGINKFAVNPGSVKSIMKALLIPFFGTDTRFLQFGFRARIR